MSLIPSGAADKRLVLLSGVEEALRRQGLRDLLDAAGGDPFDTQMLIAGEQDPQEWLASSSTVPFLSEKRTVIVRNLLRIGHPKDIRFEILKELPESARLILVADEETGDYQKQQKLDAHRTAWEKEVQKIGGLVLDFRIEPTAVKRQLVRAAAEMGKPIEERAADLLLEMTGRSLSRALEELEKVAIYVGEAEKIREADVSAAAMPSREWNVFKLVDGILEGQTGRALDQLRILIGSGSKAEGAAMQNIFPNLSRNLRLVWQAKVCLEHRASPQNLPESVARLIPDKPNISSVTDFQRNKAMAFARKLSFRQIAACFEILARSDGRLKGLDAGFTATDTLERMVLEMVEAVRTPLAVSR